MSIPPDHLCICALVAHALPDASSDTVTGVCQDHWADIKALVAEAKPEAYPDAMAKHLGITL